MSRDPGECAVRWCHETAGHDGPHRGCLLDTFGLDPTTGKTAILQLWLQGESARVRALVLVTESHETGMTWRQADELVAVMDTASRRFAHER